MVKLHFPGSHLILTAKVQLHHTGSKADSGLQASYKVFHLRNAQKSLVVPSELGLSHCWQHEVP